MALYSHERQRLAKCSFWQHENNAAKGRAKIFSFFELYERIAYKPVGKDFGTTRPLPKQPFCIL